MHLNREKLPSDRIFYYQGKRECDFVVQQGEQVTKLVQVCWDMSDANTREREIGGLLDAAAMTGCKRLLIITRDVEEVVVENGYRIEILPAWKWLLTKND